MYFYLVHWTDFRNNSVIVIFEFSFILSLFLNLWFYVVIVADLSAFERTFNIRNVVYRIVL